MVKRYAIEQITFSGDLLWCVWDRRTCSVCFGMGLLPHDRAVLYASVLNRAYESWIACTRGLRRV